MLPSDLLCISLSKWLSVVLQIAALIMIKWRTGQVFFRFPNDEPGLREKGTNAASPRTKVVVEAFVEVISSQGRLDSKIDNSYIYLDNYKMTS